MRCPTCGTEQPDESAVCTTCGTRLGQQVSQDASGTSSSPVAPPAGQPSVRPPAMPQMPGVPVPPTYTTPAEPLPPQQTPHGHMFSAVVTGVVVAAACAAIVVALSLSGAITLRPEQEIRADEDAVIASQQPTLLTGTTLTEDQLDYPVASYTYNGVVHVISAREVIMYGSSLEAAKNDDGTYTMPTADTVLSIVRTNALLEEAKNQGITVSDEEVSAYARQYSGTDDFDDIAQRYGIEVDEAKEQVTHAATLLKLKDKVTNGPIGDVPTAPDQPSDGNPDMTSVDYARYIIDLAGDEWDAEAGTWRDPDSPYALALAGYEVTNDSASYAAAQAAYAVAVQKYQQATQAASKTWTDYVNSVFGAADVHIGTLVS